MIPSGQRAAKAVDTSDAVADLRDGADLDRTRRELGLVDDVAQPADDVLEIHRHEIHPFPKERAAGAARPTRPTAGRD